MPIQLDDTATGASPIGTTPLSINGTTYYVESFSWDFPSAEIIQRDGVGSPRRRATISDLMKGTFTLQLETTGSALPAKNVWFAVPASYSPSGSAAFSASVDTCTRAAQIGEYHLVTITCTQKLN
jgi:hypothetical protein